MKRELTYALLVASLLLVVAAPPAAGHGGTIAVDPAAPDAWKYRLCNEMTTVARQALDDRDKGRPPRRFADDGGPGPAIANALVQRIFTEPAITSPKRAEAIARSYCNEKLQESS